MAERELNEQARRPPAPPGVDATSGHGVSQGQFSRLADAVTTRVAALSFFEKLFFVYMAATLAVMVFLVPPFMKADEPDHFYRTVSITNLDLVCTRDAAGGYYFEMKRKWIEAPIVMHVWDVWIYSDVKFDTRWLRADFSDPKYDEAVYIYENCNLSPAGYLPSTLGVLAGKPFENPLFSLYLGRLAGAIFFFGAVVIALSLTPATYRPLLYLFAGLPTVLHQVSAVSYDPVHLSLFAVIFALITKFAVEDRLIRPAVLLAFIVAVLWAINVRPLAYVPLILLLGAIRPSNIAPDRRRALRMLGAAATGSLFVTAAFALIYIPRLGTGENPEGIDAREQVRFIVSNPGEFLAAAYETVSRQGEWIFKQGIGVFGWTDTPLAFYAFYGVTFVAAILVYRLFERERLLLGPVQIGAILAAVGLTGVALFVSLYAVWSPVGSDVIDGLQGRYFVGLLPLLVFGLAQLATRIGKQRFVQIAVVVAAIVLFSNVVRSIDVRYYG
jgi:uncharacterized membrane protein